MGFMKTFGVGVDLKQVVALLEILERHVSALRRDVVHYAETGDVNPPAESLAKRALEDRL
jgi:hypothetical protein